MSREDYVAVAVRLFAIGLLLTAVWAGVGFTSALGHPLSAIMASLPILAVAAWLWFFPLSVARRLLPVMREPGPALSAPPRELEAVGLTIVGLWLLIGALGDAFYWGTYLVLSSRDPEVDVAWSGEQIASMITTVFEMALALGLLLGLRGVQRAVARLRGRG